MKYPRLSDKQDLRRKLLYADIADIRKAYDDACPFPTKSELMRRRHRGEEVESLRQWLTEIAEIYAVSVSTIKYYTDDQYNEQMKAKNAKAHSKVDLADYEAHKAAEIKNRMNRWQRNAALREWHYRISAKNEKRRPRYTVMGKPL